uniref:Uncharacterized protein n=1 Tax=Arundo donax TaxID=35708 RepID=A0A0A9BMX2_ARUDO
MFCPSHRKLRKGVHYPSTGRLY